MSERKRGKFERSPGGGWQVVDENGAILFGPSPSAGAVSRFIREGNIELITSSEEAVDPKPAG